MLKHFSKTLKQTFKTPNSHIHTISNPAINFILDECKHLESPNPSNPPSKTDSEPSGVEISHPWPEWVELLKKLKKNGYFDGLVDGKESNRVRTACLNFARDRPYLLRYFAGRDVEMVAGFGCPSVYRKVVNSGKRLRAYVGIDEGNVCSSCTLRGNCERAYVKAHEDQSGRTVDVMRFVLTYSLDHVTGSEDSEPMINKKVEEAIRSLIKDMVKYGKDALDFDPSLQVPSVQRSQSQQQEHRSTIPTLQGDWNCPKCKFLNIARNVKCTRCNCLFHQRLNLSGKNWDDIQLKKGDWLCLRCNFLNFAKNTRCLQCQTNPPKRQLNPGEWACDSCNYINFKRNTVCLKCDHKRPKAFNKATHSGWVEFERDER
ncbi:Zinc finger, RanBP2-type [Artemisia annua]|uniref:Zinc finger, RanBP2-type n=1 Tax=Artemisia annua TaxID=35608 RepID=A0A2U1PIT3_ARTAN|nr:Zinc finger, RanBP2-type [Artemisia annua]